MLNVAGLTPEPSCKIAPKLLKGLQGISQWAPRAPPEAQGHPRDLRRASCVFWPVPKRQLSQNISSEIDVEANS